MLNTKSPWKKNSKIRFRTLRIFFFSQMNKNFQFFKDHIRKTEDQKMDCSFVSWPSATFWTKKWRQLFLIGGGCLNIVNRERRSRMHNNFSDLYYFFIHSLFWDKRFLRTWLRNANQWCPITIWLGGLNPKPYGAWVRSHRWGIWGMKPPTKRRV